MAEENVTPIRPRVAKSAPNVPLPDNTLQSEDNGDSWEEERDLHIWLALSAVDGAVELLETCQQPALAADVLRLARDRLQAAQKLSNEDVRRMRG